MFFCVTTAPQRQTFSVRFRVPYASRVADHATSWLQQRNTRRTSCVPAASTSVGAQRRRQTDTLIFSVWARHTDAARPSLAAVSRTHRLLIPAWSGATLSFRLHPARRRFQPPPSPVVVILTASDPTYTTVHCWRSCVSGGWKPPLEQPNVTSAPTLTVFQNRLKLINLLVHFLPSGFRFLVLYTVYIT